MLTGCRFEKKIFHLRKIFCNRLKCFSVYTQQTGAFVTVLPLARARAYPTASSLQDKKQKGKIRTDALGVSLRVSFGMSWRRSFSFFGFLLNPKSLMEDL